MNVSGFCRVLSNFSLFKLICDYDFLCIQISIPLFQCDSDRSTSHFPWKAEFKFLHWVFSQMTFTRSFCRIKSVHSIEQNTYWIFFIRFWSTDTYLAMVLFLLEKIAFQSPLSLTWLRVSTVKLKEESNSEPWFLPELYSGKNSRELKEGCTHR